MRIRQALTAIPILLLTLILAACNTASGGDPAAQTGALAVAVSGLPDGVQPAVSVSGPDGYSRTITATTTLISDLSPGQYAVAADPVTTETDTYEAAVTGSPATITAGNTATATVTYTLQDDEAQTETGNLQVSISGLPAETAAAVTVSDGSGFSQTLTASASLEDLVPGRYSVVASAVDVGADTYEPAVTGSPAAVTEGGTAAVTVTYSLVVLPTTGSLQVNITGLPEELVPDVLITGPSDFWEQLPGSTLFEDVAVGTYDVAIKGLQLESSLYHWVVDNENPEVQTGQMTTINVMYLVFNPGNDGDSVDNPALRFHFHPIDNTAYQFDSPLFNPTPFKAGGIRYSSSMGAATSEQWDYLEFTWQPGDSNTFEIRFECTWLGPSQWGAIIRIQTQPGPTLAGETACGETKVITLPDNDVSYKYWIRITRHADIMAYTVYLNAHCGDKCSYQPYAAE